MTGLSRARRPGSAPDAAPRTLPHTHGRGLRGRPAIAAPDGSRLEIDGALDGVTICRPRLPWAGVGVADDASRTFRQQPWPTRRGFAAGDHELGQGDRQAEAPWTRAAGVQEQHALTPLEPRLVRMSRDDHLHAGRGRIDGERKGLMGDVDRHLACRQPRRLRQVARPCIGVVVAAHGGQRCDRREAREDRCGADADRRHVRPARRMLRRCRP